MIVALAGRRIDASPAPEARFPLANAGMVAERIHDLFVARHVSALVCAAACGADLLALEVAGQLGLLRRVVLPFPREEFRRKSVADREGEWGKSYDRLLDELEQTTDVMVIDSGPDEEQAIRQATEVILDEAIALGRELQKPVVAVAVWNKKSRGPDDMTAQFLRDAATRHLEIVEIPTV